MMMQISDKTIVQYFIRIFDMLIDEYLKLLIINNRASYDNILYKYGSRASISTTTHKQLT